MKKMMMFMLLVATMGMSVMSCSEKDEAAVVDNRTYDKELEVTKQDLIKYELIMADLEDGYVRYFLFKDSKAAYISHAKGVTTSTNYYITNNWSVSNGKLSMTLRKNGQEEIAEYSISKMYKKISSSEYVLQILLKDEDGTYVFYASEDGSKHSMAESWWSAISD